MTGTFTELIIAVAVFFASHSLPSMRGVRGHFTALLGERGFLAVYSAISAAATVWTIAAALRAPPVELWPMTVAGMWVAAVCLAPAALLLVWGLTTPNPLSVKIRPERFDPARPGALAITRHPLMWAFGLWGLGHLVPNGDAGTAVLFALLGGFGLMGCAILDARRSREYGLERWRELAAHTSAVPFAAIVAGRARMPWSLILSWRTILALALYIVAIVLHPMVIGVSPLPP